jgi:hypothetical protein
VKPKRSRRNEFQALKSNKMPTRISLALNPGYGNYGTRCAL